MPKALPTKSKAERDQISQSVLLLAFRTLEPDSASKRYLTYSQTASILRLSIHQV